MVLAMTGASGAAYGLRLLELLVRHGRRVHLTISRAASAVLQTELGLAADLERFELRSLLAADGRAAWGEATPLARALGVASRRRPPAGEDRDPAELVRYHHHQDWMAPIASGSYLTAGMVVCPCSGGTLSAIVHGRSDNLIQRAAEVHLKERRPLILATRETPLSAVQLENMRRAARLGAVVLPAAPGWYHGVSDLLDLADFVVARILDQLGVAHGAIRRWGDWTDGGRREAGPC